MRDPKLVDVLEAEVREVDRALAAGDATEGDLRGVGLDRSLKLDRRPRLAADRPVAHVVEEAGLVIGTIDP